MKGYCHKCNKEYARLDKHEKYKHNEHTKLKSMFNNVARLEKAGKGQKRLEEDTTTRPEEARQEKTISETYPNYFFESERKLKIRHPNERVPIDIDEQSCLLANYLRKNKIRSWLKNSSNPFTLMSLARMIHLLNFCHIVQPSCHPPLDLQEIHRDVKKNRQSKPKKMKRFRNLFRKMDQIILKEFKPLFLKYPNEVKSLLKNYEEAYK